MPKASRLAILDVGYADGLPRLLSNNGHAYFAGELCNIVGRISMDATTVDVGQLSVAEGDWLELIGAQISVDKVAGQAQTIAYEVFTGLSQRLTKVYIED
jgi:alanine racemase